MQSRLTLVSKLNKILFTTPKYKTIPQSLLSTSSGNIKAQGDDAMTQGVDTEGETANPKPDNDDENIIPTKEDDHYMHHHPKTVPPNLSTPKLQTPGVSTPVDPHFQQKRTKFISPEQKLSCAGLDGWPWPEDKDMKKDKDADRKEQEEDDKEFFKHHKASPLSEIEIAEKRKPLERVMDGGYFGDEKVLTWKPEQLDTAEQSLLRATEMFREAAARGVPDWPHSKRLRELRGEDW